MESIFPAGSVPLCPLSHVEFEFARLYRPTAAVLTESSKCLQPLWVNAAARARMQTQHTISWGLLDTKVDDLVFATVTCYRACAPIHTSSWPTMPLSHLVNPDPPWTSSCGTPSMPASEERVKLCVSVTQTAPLNWLSKTGQKVLIYESRNIFDIHFRRCGQLKKQPETDPHRQWCSVTLSACACVSPILELFWGCFSQTHHRCFWFAKHT